MLFCTFIFSSIFNFDLHPNINLHKGRKTDYPIKEMLANIIELLTLMDYRPVQHLRFH